LRLCSSWVNLLDRGLMVGWVLADVMTKNPLCQEKSALGKVRISLVSDNTLRCDLRALSQHSTSATISEGYQQNCGKWTEINMDQ